MPPGQCTEKLAFSDSTACGVRTSSFAQYEPDLLVVHELETCLEPPGGIVVECVSSVPLLRTNRYVIAVPAGPRMVPINCSVNGHDKPAVLSLWRCTVMFPDAAVATATHSTPKATVNTNNFDKSLIVMGLLHAGVPSDAPVVCA